MPFKFARATARHKGMNKTGKYVGQAVKSRKRKTNTGNIGRMAKRIKRMERTVETKSGVTIITDGTEYGHNAMNIVNITFLRTNAGTMDNENGLGQRLGDRITLLRAEFRMIARPPT